MYEAWTNQYFSYDPSTSTTHGQKTTKTDDLTFIFGSGWIQGSFAEDVLTLGDPENEQNNISIPSFDFGLVEAQDSIFDGCFDAVVGLAYPSMAQSDTLPFFDQLMRTNELRSNYFSFFFSLDPAN
jgi:hypothetical protein